MCPGWADLLVNLDQDLVPASDLPQWSLSFLLLRPPHRVLSDASLLLYPMPQTLYRYIFFSRFLPSLHPVPTVSAPSLSRKSDAPTSILPKMPPLCILEHSGLSPQTPLPFRVFRVTPFFPQGRSTYHLPASQEIATAHPPPPVWHDYFLWFVYFQLLLHIPHHTQH